MMVRRLAMIAAKLFAASVFVMLLALGILVVRQDQHLPVRTAAMIGVGFGVAVIAVFSLVYAILGIIGIRERASPKSN